MAELKMDFTKMAESFKRMAEKRGLFVGYWIPVSEELPEKAFGCLVTVEEDDIHGDPHRVIYPDFVGYDGETWNNADGEPISFEVIAWMPLPEPYKTLISED